MKRAWLLCLLLATIANVGRATGHFTIVKYSIDAGAGTVSGTAGYRVLGVVGQSDASPPFGGGRYRLRGGILAPAPAPLFKDGFESGDLSAWSNVKHASTPAASLRNAGHHLNSD